MTEIVLFTSTAGIDQLHHLMRLRSYILQNYLHEEQVADLSGEKLLAKERELIPILEVPNVEVKVFDGEIRNLHDEINSKLNKSVAEINRILEKGKARYIFLRTHASYYVRGQFTSWIHAERGFLSFLKSIGVSKVVVLNDNIYKIRSTINERDDFYTYRLKELLIWRDVEVFAADIIAKAVLPDEARYGRAYWVAINHPLSVIADLLCDPKKIPIYLAFSISRIRELEQAGRKDEADGLYRQNVHFRRFMSKRFVAFDPTTIDERPIQIRYLSGLDEIRKIDEDIESAALQGKVSDVNQLRDQRLQRWKRGVVIDTSIAWPSITAETLGQRSKAEFNIPFEEVEEIYPQKSTEKMVPLQKSLIDRHINSRDFRIIDQSVGVIAYRPTLGGELSGGVEAELDYVSSDSSKISRVIVQNDDALPIPKLYSPRKPFDKERFDKNYASYADLSTEEGRQEAFEDVARYIEDHLRKARDQSNVD